MLTRLLKKLARFYSIQRNCMTLKYLLQIMSLQIRKLPNILETRKLLIPSTKSFYFSDKFITEIMKRGLIFNDSLKSF